MRATPTRDEIFDRLHAMHRRAQAAEARVAVLEGRLAELRESFELSERQSHATFMRMRAAHDELRDIFVRLADVFPYPMDAGRLSLHSVMDGRHGFPMGGDGVWANCFLPSGGVSSYRVRDEALRAISELESLRR